MIKVTAWFVHILLWLKSAISLMLIGLFIAAIICIVRDEINILIIVSLAGFGLVTGIVWAEKIRRTIGLSNYHGRLMAHPEIDGSRRE